MIYLYLFGTCFHFIYVFMIIGNNYQFQKLTAIKYHTDILSYTLFRYNLLKSS